ncbi:MAG: TauD/TfdA family dioxygenase [Janthinobacterium sp.]
MIARDGSAWPAARVRRFNATPGRCFVCGRARCRHSTPSATAPPSPVRHPRCRHHCGRCALSAGGPGSMLHAQELPSEGGDTLFADMHKAWDGLPEALRAAVQDRSAAHSYTARYSESRFAGNWRPTLTAEQLAQVQEVIHPVVRTHPENGRKALFVSEGFTTRIVGLPEDESRQILAELQAHSVLEQNIYRHQWQPRDLVFWDNRSLIHLAAGCPAHLRRKLYRTTIQGDAPF